MSGSSLAPKTAHDYISQRERKETRTAFIEDMFGLDGSTVVITGGSGVLAGSMAEAFLRAGAAVSLWGRNEAGLGEAARRVGELTGHTDRVDTRVVDMMVEGSVSGALAGTVARFGTVDVLVNTVGGNKGKAAFVDTDAAEFQEVLALNLVAGLLIPSKILCRFWKEHGLRASIINMASMASYRPLSGVWAYDAAKAGVLNLTMATARELAPYGIRVNAIAPGFFLGRQNRDLLMDPSTGEHTARGRTIIERTPFGRFGEPAELAGALLFLASEKASGFVTGACIPVDGGFLTDSV